MNHALYDAVLYEIAMSVVGAGQASDNNPERSEEYRHAEQEPRVIAGNGPVSS